MNAVQKFPLEEVTEFCQRWKIKRLELFGSALDDNLSPSSDIDLLVQFDEDFSRTLTDQIQMQEELEIIFDREVDFIVRETIERSPNPYKRNNILKNTRELYDSG
ncbi:MAG: nucleotidyltransferase domain-containing protein [Anaerolineales bacterium]|nr:nucleotidyltransferase domain-containing protein [Anaerolineales bacterium]